MNNNKAQSMYKSAKDRHYLEITRERLRHFEARKNEAYRIEALKYRTLDMSADENFDNVTPEQAGDVADAVALLMLTFGADVVVEVSVCD